MRVSLLASSVFASCVFAACSPAVDGNVAEGEGEGEGEGEDISLPVSAEAWTYTTVEGATCGNGSPVGVATNGGSSSRLVLFLEGGGACWNDLTCSNGFAAFVSEDLPPAKITAITQNGAGIFNRNAGDNPFAADHFAFVPYCTGDVHSGTQAVSEHGVAHVGANNFAVMLPRILATFPDVTEVVLAGTSAGGYGVLFNAERVKAALSSSVELSLLMDSAVALPPFPGGENFLNQQLAAWQPAICDGCANLQDVFDNMLVQLPGTRVGMTMSTQDSTLRGFFTTNGVSISAAAWEEAVNTFIDGHDDEDFATFLEASSRHVYVFDNDLSATVVSDVSLAAFYAGVAGDGPFVSARP
jgi:hypothetical protein